MGKIKKNGESRILPKEDNSTKATSCQVLYNGNDKLNPSTESGFGEIVLYQPEGEIRLEVRVENETVWLTQAQMAELFDVKRQAVTKHVKNIFQTGELEELATSSILELVQKEGRRSVKRLVTLYNLDMIISVGYRVNTERGIKFRRWANQVLKDYMLKGFAVNQRKIATNLQIMDRLHEQRQMIENHVHSHLSTRTQPLTY